jgi:1-acyl-sn-glycerol-3-phosphate acyltransferase
MLGRCRWFSKIELRWVPLLGWGIWAMGMPMVSRKWMKDQKELDRVFAGIVVQMAYLLAQGTRPISCHTNCLTWLISFSEATRLPRRNTKPPKNAAKKTTDPFLNTFSTPDPNASLRLSNNYEQPNMPKLSMIWQSYIRTIINSWKHQQFGSR